MFSLDKGYAQAKSGWLIGEKLVNGVKVFRGILYAAPPVGELRWKPPIPPAQWLGVRKALNFGNEAVQHCDLNNLDMPQDRMEQLLNSTLPISEDCLYLNIWTPAETSNDNLPVFVWVHGGSFQIGAGSSFLYDSAVLAEKGIVVVTINYRLGLFGFFAHTELTEESGCGSSGNYGLLDQLMALKWVKENIAGFGGNPGSIAVGGQSAGGLSVCALVASPLASGLFNRAIIQSGPSFGFEEYHIKLRDAEEEGKCFLDASGAGSISKLRQKPMLEIFNKSCEYSFTPMIVIDGWLLPDFPGNVIRVGKHNRVALLLGSTSHEFSDGYSPENGLSEEEYYKKVQSRYFGKANDLLKLYPAGDTVATASSAIRLCADRLLAGTRLIAGLAAKHGSAAYLYYFTRVLNKSHGGFYGANHSAELPFLFHLADRGGIFPWDERKWEDFDYQYSETVMYFWTNFIKNGDPNGENLPEWLKYNKADDSLMEFGDIILPATVPHKENLAVLESIFSYR